VRVALYNGPTLGASVINLHVTLRQLSTSGNRVHSALLNACASRCVKGAMEKVGTTLLEPVMSIEAALIYDERGDAYSALLLNELSHRRAIIEEISQDEHLMTVKATLPLSETRGIATKIRSITSGLCSFHMVFLEYRRIPPEEKAHIAERRARGEV